jgi:cell division septation protein DedD
VPADKFTLLTLGKYKGLRWSGIDVVNGTHEFFNSLVGCGYRTGIVSGSFVAIAANRVESDAKIASPPGTPFDFNSVYLTAGWKNDLTVRVEGFRAGARLYAKTVVVHTAQPTRFTFGFRGIDTLRISSSGGVDAGICQGGDCRPGPEVVMDDFSFAFGVTSKVIALLPQLTEQELAPQPPEVPKVIALLPQRTEQEFAPQPPEVPAETPKSLRAAFPAKPSGNACPDGPYHGVQVGAFRSLKHATALRDKMSAKYGSAQVHVKERGGTPFYRVVVGCMDQSKPAKDLLKTLRDDGVQGLVVRVSESEIGNRL